MHSFIYSSNKTDAGVLLLNVPVDEQQQRDAEWPALRDDHAFVKTATKAYASRDKVLREHRSFVAAKIAELRRQLVNAGRSDAVEQLHL
jgi:hypothetical protein